MADVKITDLTALAADVDALDRLEIEDNSAAAGSKSKKVTAAELVNATLISTALGPLAGFRNKVINGDFSVWQRGTTESTASEAYVADRWAKGNFQQGTHSRQAFAASGDHPGNSQYVLRTSGDGSTSCRVKMGQGIESVDTIPLRGKTITASYYLRCVSATMPTSSLGSLRTSFGATSATADGNFASTNYWAAGIDFIDIAQGSLPTTWTKYSVTHTVPTNATNIALSIGFLTTATAGTGDWFEISQVQIEEGPIATDFEPRPFGTELALCQRYYEKSYNLDNNLATITPVGALFNRTGTASTEYINIEYAVQKRNSPTLVYYAPSSGNTGNATNYTDTADVSATQYQGGISRQTVSIATTAADKFVGVHFTADAEL